MSFTIVFLGQEVYQKSGADWRKFRYLAQDLPVLPNPRRTGNESILNLPIINALGNHEIQFRTKENEPLPTFYGGKQDNMDTFWFEFPSETVPPSFVYLYVKYKALPNEYKSNLAETTL